MSAYLAHFLAWLLTSSWQAAILTVVVLGAQWVFQKKLSAQWRHALWFLVVARLALPFSHSSPISVFNYARLKGPVAGVVSHGMAPENAPAPSVNPAPVAASEIVTTPAMRENSRVQIPSLTAPLIPGRHHWFRPENAANFCGLVWAAGLLFFMARILGQNMLFLRRLGATPELTDGPTLALFARCQAELGVRTRIRLSETTILKSPALHGFFRPTLLLPAGLAGQFNAAELRHIFLHELAHVKRHDMAALWLATLCKVLHWFNPVLWYGFRRMAADRELACDELALSHAGERERGPYGGTILKLLEYCAHPATAPGAMGILEENDQMRRRISMIATFKRPTRWSSLAGVLLLAVALVTLTDAQTDKPSVNPQGPAHPGRADTAAAPDEPPFRLAIDLRDGSRVIGEPLEDVLRFHSSELGDMKLPWAKISSLEYNTDSGTARLTTTNGDGFTVQLASDTLRVETSFGKSELPVKLIRSFRVSPPANPNAPASTVSSAEARPRLTIELRDGSHVVGHGFPDDTLSFHSTGMGNFKLTWAGIRSIDYPDASSEIARLAATNGDVYEVQLADSSVRVETSFGTNELPVNLIRSIQVSPSASPGQFPPGLVALWSGEGDGNDSVGGNTATLTDITFAEGKVGRAFSFNGISSSIKIPASRALDLGAGDGFTIMAWIKPLDVGGFQPLFEWTDYNGLNFSINARPTDSGGLWASVTDQSGNRFCNTHTGLLAVGVFQHIAFTYDKASSMATWYLNGVMVAQRQLSGHVAGTKGDLIISRRNTHQGDWSSNRSYSGLMDEIAIYNRALPASEIQEICTETNHGDPLAKPEPSTGWFEPWML